MRLIVNDPCAFSCVNGLHKLTSETCWGGKVKTNQPTNFLSFMFLVLFLSIKKSSCCSSTGLRLQGMLLWCHFIDMAAVSCYVKQPWLSLLIDSLVGCSQTWLLLLLLCWWWCTLKRGVDKAKMLLVNIITFPVASFQLDSSSSQPAEST